MSKKTFKYGDVVQLTRKTEKIICVVAGIRRIQRGRRAGMDEYKLAPIDKPESNTYAYRAYGVKFLVKAKGKFTGKQIKVALEREDGTRTEVKEHKEERVERGRKALTDIDIVKGDEVLVRYSNVPSRWEPVLNVNFKTGKIGIPNPRAVRDNGFTEVVRYAMKLNGTFRQSKGPRPYRWIHPGNIDAVRSQQKECPCTVTARIKKAIEKKGWYQIKFGSEFIESSYVLADTKKNAAMGSTFETVDGGIYQDPNSGIYWRNTGCFD